MSVPILVRTVLSNYSIKNISLSNKVVWVERLRNPSIEEATRNDGFCEPPTYPTLAAGFGWGGGIVVKTLAGFAA